MTKTIEIFFGLIRQYILNVRLKNLTPPKLRFDMEANIIYNNLGHLYHSLQLHKNMYSRPQVDKFAASFSQTRLTINASLKMLQRLEVNLW